MTDPERVFLAAEIAGRVILQKKISIDREKTIRWAQARHAETGRAVCVWSLVFTVREIHKGKDQLTFRVEVADTSMKAERSFAQRSAIDRGLFGRGG